MEAIDLKITPLECDRKCFVYSNGNSVPFCEIAYQLEKRLRRLKVNVYGEYNPKDLLDTYVYYQVDYEGYHFRERLEKELFINDDDIDKFYDWLADKIAYCFGKKFFLKGDD